MKIWTMGSRRCDEIGTVRMLGVVTGERGWFRKSKIASLDYSIAFVIDEVLFELEMGN